MGCTPSHPTAPSDLANPISAPPTSSSHSSPPKRPSPMASSVLTANSVDRRSSALHPQPHRSPSPAQGGGKRGDDEERKERGASVDSGSQRRPASISQQQPHRVNTIHPSTVTLIPPSPSPTSHPRSPPVAGRSSPSTSPDHHRSSARARAPTPLLTTSSPSPTPAPPGSRYQLTSSLLGKGHFAKVALALDTHTGVEVAIKVIDKKEMCRNRGIVESELSVLKRMGRHRHIVSLLDFYEDERKFYIVMELCQGGDLFGRIVEQGKYSETQAVRSCKQIAEALLYIHSCGITHRDLKPENILLLNSSPESDLKIADFGLSKILPNIDDVMRTVCGTWAYCAPEVISHKSYTSRVDNWTLGVLMYILLCGYHPFDCYGDLPEPELLDKIMRVDYEFEDPVWEHISADAKQLIQQLLVYQPDQRLSLQAFLDSNWIRSGGKGGSGADLTIVQARLSRFSHKTFRALVTAKVAIKKFRASISRSPRTPGSSTRIVPVNEQRATYLADTGEGVEEGDLSDGEGGAGGHGAGETSLSGLSFLQRLDKKEVRGSGSVVMVAEHRSGASVSGLSAPLTVAVGGEAKEKEKGGLGRGMRISEEERQDSGSEEKEQLDDEDLTPH